jgi:hypothetical protein
VAPHLDSWTSEQHEFSVEEAAWPQTKLAVSIEVQIPLHPERKA